MKSMMAAIQKKKAEMAGGHQATHLSSAGGSSQPPDHGGGDKSSGLHEFVAGLNDHEKSQLKGILDKSSGTSGPDIAKGAASSHEKEMIAKQSSKEDQENDAMDEQSEHMDSGKSDDIALSMLDHKSIAAGPETQPRNLGERMKMGLAQKLKAKGKI